MLQIEKGQDIKQELYQKYKKGQYMRCSIYKIFTITHRRPTGCPTVSPTSASFLYYG